MSPLTRLDQVTKSLVCTRDVGGGGLALTLRTSLAEAPVKTTATLMMVSLTRKMMTQMKRLGGGESGK